MGNAKSIPSRPQEQALATSRVDDILIQIAETLDVEEPQHADLLAQQAHDQGLLNLMVVISPLSGARNQIPEGCWQDVVVCFVELAERCLQVAQRHKDATSVALTDAQPVNQNAQLFYAQALTLYWEIYDSYRDFIEKPLFLLSRSRDILDAGTFNKAMGCFPRLTRISLRFPLTVIQTTELGKAYFGVNYHQQAEADRRALDACLTTRGFIDGSQVAPHTPFTTLGFATICLNTLQSFYRQSQSVEYKTFAEYLERHIKSLADDEVSRFAEMAISYLGTLATHEQPSPFKEIAIYKRENIDDLRERISALAQRQWSIFLFPLISLAAKNNLSLDAVAVILRFLMPACPTVDQTAKTLVTAGIALGKAVPVSAILRFYQAQKGVDLERLQAISDRAVLIADLKQRDDGDHAAQATCRRFLL